MCRRILWILAVVSALAAAALPAGAQGVPGSITYQGKLTDTAGQAVPDNTYQVQFKLYIVDTGGTPFWTSAAQSVQTRGGLFTTEIASITPADLSGQTDVWLEVWTALPPASLAPLSPRAKLASAPFALRAGDLILPFSGMSSTSGPTFQITNSGTGPAVRAEGTYAAELTGRVCVDGDLGVGTSSPGAKLEVAGQVKITGGDPGAGKVLTSDSSGLGSWTTPASGLPSGTSGQTPRHDGAAWVANSAIYNDGSSVGIGTTTTTAKLDVRSADTAGTGLYAEAGPSGGKAAIFKGNIQVKSAGTGLVVAEIGEGLDYAEGFDVSNGGKAAPGTVLVIDPGSPGKLAVSSRAYDRKVAGVVAGANGLGSGVRLGTGKFDHDVALAGRVYCNVDARHGAVKPGDLLTTSPTPGFAMVVKDHSKAQGAILGKAMQRLSKGQKGSILVLVTLQ